MVGASATCAAACSAAMNAYFSLTAAPSRSTLPLFSGRRVPSPFPDSPFQFAQPRTFGQFQRRLVAGVVLSVFPHPVTDSRLTEPMFARDLGDRPLPFHHQFRRFLTKLGENFWYFFANSLILSGRTLFGPQSGKWEARHRHLSAGSELPQAVVHRLHGLVGGIARPPQTRLPRFGWVVRERLLPLRCIGDVVAAGARRHQGHNSIGGRRHGLPVVAVPPQPGGLTHTAGCIAVTSTVGGNSASARSASSSREPII